MLPLDMRNKIDLTAANYGSETTNYGSEIPDCFTGIYRIGDQTRHHAYYRFDRTLQDGISTTRAKKNIIWLDHISKQEL